jgi:hypothetical protein
MKTYPYHTPEGIIELVEQHEYETARDIIADLLNHPYPYDLMAIRKEAARYDSETSAMVEMDAYCTEEAALKARADWNNAQETAKKFLKKQ